MAATVDFADIKVSFSAARVILAAASIVGKALAAHKALVEQRVVFLNKAIIGKFLVEFAEFQVGSDKFQLEFD